MKSEMNLLTPRRVATLLGFKPRTITRWCREGVFPTAHRVGRVWRIRADDSRLHILLYMQEAEKREDGNR